MRPYTGARWPRHGPLRYEITAATANKLLRRQYVPRRASDGTVLGYFRSCSTSPNACCATASCAHPAPRSVSAWPAASRTTTTTFLALLLGADLLDSVQDPGGRDLLAMMKSSAERGAAILRSC
jgi:hypothetical protein